jgi:hypothetical protein
MESLPDPVELGKGNPPVEFNMLLAAASELQTLVQSSMQVVVHGADANVPRPNAVAVYWIGTVDPVNSLDNDLWLGGT